MMSCNNEFSGQTKKKYPAQALVEVAVLLPILLILVLGALDFGRMYYTKIVITNAAREGANYLSRNPTDKNLAYAGTWKAIQNEGKGSGVTLLSTNVDWTNTNCCAVGSPVTIKVTKQVDLIFDGFLQAIGVMGGPVTLTSQVKMVVQ